MEERGSPVAARGYSTTASQRVADGLATAVAYVRVLKPRETLLLSLMGVCTAVLAGHGSPPADRFFPVTLAIIMGCGGANALTNYLDRAVDARMRRTMGRVIPSGLIHPPERALAWAILLIATALLIALSLSPWAFLAGLMGIAAAVTGRKTAVTHFMGSISSCAPVLVAWFGVNSHVEAPIVFLSLIILVWTPVHVWALMIVFREDYLRAGVNIFPLDRSLDITFRISLALSLVLYAAAVVLWYLGGFGWLYFGIANIVGPAMVLAALRVVRSTRPADAYRTFKLSAYPFLGLTFFGLVLDTWAWALF